MSKIKSSIVVVSLDKRNSGVTSKRMPRRFMIITTKGRPIYLYGRKALGLFLKQEIVQQIDTFVIAFTLL